jgi:hypothetical protein
MTVEYGFQGTHITNIAALLAQCPSWQTVCGVATDAEASGYIHLVDVQPEPDAPYAVVYPGDTSVAAVDTGGALVFSGTVDILLVLSPSGAGQAAKYFAFDAAVSNIVLEMQERARDGYAIIRNLEISKDAYGRFTDPEKRGRGDMYAAQITVAIGVQ